MKRTSWRWSPAWAAGAAVAVAGLLPACSPAAEAPATWSTPWSHTDRGFSGVFTIRDRCLMITVDGGERLAVVPQGSSLEDGRLATPAREYALDSAVTVGGAAFTREDAAAVTTLAIPSACESRSEDVWLVTG